MPNARARIPLACRTAIPPNEPTLRQHPQRHITVRLGLRLVLGAGLAAIVVSERSQFKLRAVVRVPRREITAVLRVGVLGQVLGLGQCDPHQRRVVRADRERHIARLRDALRACKRLQTRILERPRVVILAREQLGHLRRALDEDLARVAHAIVVALALARADADQRVVRVVVVFLEKVCVIVAHQRHIHFARELDEPLVDGVLLGDVVL